MANRRTERNVSILVDFNEAKETTIPRVSNGTGEMNARLQMDGQGKIIPMAIHSGGSIGPHTRSAHTRATGTAHAGKMRVDNLPF